MKKYIKNSIILNIAFILFITITSVNAQNNSNNYSNDELNELVFRNIIEQCDTPFLLNLSNVQSSLFELTNQNLEPQTADDWLLAYNDIVQSYIPQNNPYKSITNLYHNLEIKKYQTDDEVIQLPIGIIFQDYNYVDVENGIENQQLTVSNNGYTLKLNDLPSNIIKTKTLFSANIVTKSISIYEKLRIYLDNEYIISKENITSVEIYQNGNSLGNLALNNYMDIELQEGLNNFKVIYQSSSNVQWQNNFTINGKSLISSSSSTSSPFTISKIINTSVTNFNALNIYGKNQSAKIKVFYGCNNSEKKIQKPAIFVSGYNPANIENFVTLITKFDTNGFLTKLHQQNHDVIVIRFDYGSDRIENQAILTKKILQYINTQKFSNNSYFENVVTGYSSGAVVARMALKMMEKEYQDTHLIEKNHHSRLLISYDGEHKGANIPLAAQHSLISILENPQWYLPSTDLLSALEHYALISSPSAKDFFIYHYTQTGNIDSPGQDAHPFFHEARSKLSSDYYFQPVLYEKPGDYPIIRNVGIADGAATIINHPLNTLSAWGTALRIDKHIGFLGWDRHHFMEWKTVNGYEHPIFTRIFRKRFLWNPSYEIIHNEVKVVSNSSKRIDGVQGSTVELYNKLRVMTKVTYLSPSPSIDIESTDCFLPTVSALDISTTGFQYDLRAENLLWDTPTSQTKQFGYPSIQFGASQYTKTPFDAIYAAEINMKHGAGSEDDPETPLLTEFMLDEVQYEDIWLQFREIGSHYPYHYYPAKFEAVNSIICGKNVTYKTQKKPLIVKENAVVEMKAGKFIMFEPGTLIEFKAELLAHIGPVDACGTFNKMGYTESENYSNNNTKLEAKPLNKIEKIGRSSTISPNPTTESATLLINNFKNGNTYDINIYNIQGQLVKSLEAKNKKSQLNLSGFNNGLYFIKVFDGEKTEIIKLIKR